MKRRPRAGTLFGVAFLLVQAALVVYARVSPMRYFCAAPYSKASRYEIEVSLGGRALPRHEVRQRYHLPPAGPTHYPIEHLLDVVDRVERQRAAEIPAAVTVRYTVLDDPEITWRWPRP